jgi:hypothetical protein
MQRICTNRVIAILFFATLISGILAFLSVVLFPAYSEPFVKIMTFVIAIDLFIAFDHYVMKGIFTIEELKKGNIAHAIYLLAVAILLHGAFSMF